MKKIVLIFIMLSISIAAIYSSEKEKVYILVSSGKSPGYLGITFVIESQGSCFVKFIRYEVGFSYMKKNIRYIRKVIFNPIGKYRYERLENGDIWVKFNNSDIRSVTDLEYHTTENFRKTREYEVFKKYLPELFEMDNYDMLLYLDNNFTKYYGEEKYRNEPLL